MITEPTYVEFEIKPECDKDEYDHLLTIYRKTYTPGKVDMCIFGEDFQMDIEEVRGMVRYLKGRLTND